MAISAVQRRVRGLEIPGKAHTAVSYRRSWSRVCERNLTWNIFWNNASFRLPIIPGTGINRHLCSVTFEFTEAWPRASIPQLPGAISLKMELRSMFNRVMLRKIVVNYATRYDFVNIPVFFSFMYDATSKTPVSSQFC